MSYKEVHNIKLTLSSTLDELILKFNDDRNKTIAEIYSLHRRSFLKYFMSRSSNQELILDCFQESIIAVYENLMNEKVKGETTLKTYLYAIGKNQLASAQAKKDTQHEGISEKTVRSTIKTIEKEDSNFEVLQRAIAQLGEKCQELLSLFYYKKYSINAIMYEMNYQNENTVKANKSRCMSQLRTIIKSNP